jgi:hypothetical protein
MDDEYFRMIISTDPRVSGHHAAKRLWPAVQRSLSNPRKLGLRNVLFIKTYDTERELSLQRSKDFKIDCGRINTVLIRIIQGIFFREKKAILPLSYKITVFSPFSSDNLEQKESLKALIKTYYMVGDGIFSYGMYFYKDYSGASIWSLSFFENIEFICTVSPVGDDHLA